MLPLQNDVVSKSKTENKIRLSWFGKNVSRHVFVFAKQKMGAPHQKIMFGILFS
jgi:hypothetical protein